MLYADDKNIEFETDYGRRIFKVGSFSGPSKLTSQDRWFTHFILVNNGKRKRGKKYKITKESALHFLHFVKGE